MPAHRQQGPRDGQHDFDPLIGGWKFDLKVRLHPLTSSTTWVEFRGNGSCHKVWNGRANLDQIALNGPSGPVEGLTLRLFNPQTGQRSLYWANRKDGKVVVPQIGQFKDGHGEFYAQDMFDGKSIFVRFDWTNMTNSPHFEQSFSEDGGKTWEANWISNQTRVSDDSAQAPSLQNSNAAESVKDEVGVQGRLSVLDFLTIESEIGRK